VDTEENEAVKGIKEVALAGATIAVTGGIGAGLATLDSIVNGQADAEAVALKQLSEMAEDAHQQYVEQEVEKHLEEIAEHIEETENIESAILNRYARIFKHSRIYDEFGGFIDF
jgi:tRNA(Ser,Leu) C12 N-acetylase TAN1